ncbi:hypothetical protein ACFV6B_13215 [Streptomyces microflavus]|uniref:hypothetical protein n=1 Tax=Streptomyces microflavus TaxID=1919 RepID=UPI00365F4AAB
MFSAAEPAHPASTPPIGGSPDHAPGPHDPTGPAADTPSRVVPFARRTPRTGRGRRTPQPAHPERAVAPDSPQQRLALDVEAWFRHHETTLTDEATAHAYRTTLDFVQLLLDSSHTEHRLNGDAHQHLTGMMRALRDAPDAL